VVVGVAGLVHLEVVAEVARETPETHAELLRGRTYRMLTAPPLLELKQETIEGVHEEALKAFEAGERELA